MVRPGLRSHSMARLPTRLPGSRTVLHYVRRRPSRVTCPVTGKKLQGVPAERQANMGKLTKTQKRPSRPYAGVLSHTALEAFIIDAVDEETAEN